MRPTDSSPGEHTRAVHPPAFDPPVQRPLGLPVYRTAAFAFADSEEYAEVLGGRRPGYSYSRVDNPTADAFARAVAALEGVGVDGEVAGQPFASGMAAISTVLLTLCRAGSEVVVQRAVYGGTYGVLEHVLARFGVRAVYVDATDVVAVRAATGPATALLYVETLANPTMAVADLPALAEVAQDAGVPLVVDSTFASPAVCRPLEHGADLVVHSATKYLGGHSDVTGGLVVGPPDLLARVRDARLDLGGSLAPDEAWALHRGLATLPLRVARQCASAAVLAGALAADRRVARVDYPGLPTHPGHATAARLFDADEHGTRFGAVLTVTPHGGADAGRAWCDRMRLAEVATSLGGVRTKVSHVASTTHRQMDAATLAAAGIDAGAVRVSVGLEDPADLLADLTAALPDGG